MKEINLTLETRKVEMEVRKLRPNVKVVEGTPIFDISKDAAKLLGINNIFQYWLWKRGMRKAWKKRI